MYQKEGAFKTKTQRWFKDGNDPVDIFRFIFILNFAYGTIVSRVKDYLEITERKESQFPHWKYNSNTHEWQEWRWSSKRHEIMNLSCNRNESNNDEWFFRTELDIKWGSLYIYRYLLGRSFSDEGHFRINCVAVCVMGCLPSLPPQAYQTRQKREPQSNMSLPSVLRQPRAGWVTS